MAKRKPATVREFVYLHGAEGEYLDINDLTPEERKYFQKALAYRAVESQRQYYARRGYELVPEDKSLLVPPTPVGRFA